VAVLTVEYAAQQLEEAFQSAADARVRFSESRSICCMQVLLQAATTTNTHQPASWA
jgi:hypothetical protein